MSDTIDVAEVVLSPAAEKAAQAPDAFYMFQLPNGELHQSYDLAYIKKTYPDATITTRVTLDGIGQPVFSQYQGQQPWEKAPAAAEEAAPPTQEAKAEAPAEETAPAQPARARDKK